MLAAVRGEVPRGVAVLAKLAPGGGVVELARAASRAGADAVVLMQGFPGLVFDPATWQPALGAVTGTVSGPAVLALALRCVWDVHAALPDLPVVGVGGVRSGFDVVPMLLAGATAVQVGTSLLRDPSAATRITDELAGLLEQHDIKRPADPVGARAPRTRREHADDVRQHRLRQRHGRPGPLCVGIDPHPALLDAWGLTDSPFGLEKFALSAVEAVAGTVAVVKPQSAFFERHGSAGIAVLEKVIAECRAPRRPGAARRQARRHRHDRAGLRRRLSGAEQPAGRRRDHRQPFLGIGSLDPIIDTALRHDAGVFVLALTSNPEGPQFQPPPPRTAAPSPASCWTPSPPATPGAEGLGSIGAVVGATIGETSEFLDVNGPLLVPGVGAQGGTVDDVRRIFGGAIRNVLPSSSREVLEAGPDKAALHDAAARAAEQFADLVGPTV